MSQNENGRKSFLLCGVGGDLKKICRTNILKSYRTQVIFERIFERKFTLVGSLIKNVTLLPESTLR